MVNAKLVSNFQKFVFKCSKCEHKIVCDRKRFEESPKTIECYKCGCVHKVVSHKIRKYGIEFDII